MSNANNTAGTHRASRTVGGLATLALLSSVFTGCSKSGDTFVTPPSNTGTPTATTALDQAQALPGVVLNATSVTGASGPSGAFEVGDRPALRFTLTRTDGSGLPLSELDGSEVFLSGPSFNYQRVFP